MEGHVKQPWEVYFDEFKRRARYIPLRWREWGQESDDLEILERMINQSRQATFDHLRYDRHWDEEEAMALIDRFTTGILIPWLKDGTGNWEFLKEDLRNEWTFPSAGPATDADDELLLGK